MNIENKSPHAYKSGGPVPVPTPHISAEEGSFADFLIMPGDPLRAQFIAENFLVGAVCVNEVRGMLGYTGKYNGRKVSVMASGMGCPSMGIYSYELFNFYGVETIVRVGSCGGIAQDLELLDIVIAQSTSTNSNYLSQFKLPGTYAPCGDFKLMKKASDIAENLNIRASVGPILTSDLFYDVNKDFEKWEQMGVIATEMETAALYANAAYAKKKALSLLTVSDFVTGNRTATTTSEERQTSFTDMIKIALELSL